MTSIKKFFRPLILVLAIIFVTISVTGCSSTINTIKTIKTIKTVSQSEKARKVFKGVMGVGDVIDLKRNASDLADKILKHK